MPLILMVIAIHMDYNIEPDMVGFTFSQIDFSSFSGIDFYHIFRMIFDTIRGICNPGFFLISGYLFFLNVTVWNKHTYAGKLKKRLFTLFIPYVLWNTIAALTTPISLIGGRIVKQDGDLGRIPEYFQSILDKGILNIYWHFNTWNETNINILGWNTPSLGPVSIPMWFLQTLICLSIITPLIYLIVRYLRVWGLVVLGALCFTGIWFSFPGFGISPIFYFTLGAYFSINKRNMIFDFRKYRYPIFAVAIISFAGSIFFRYGLNTAFNYCSGLATLSATLSLFIAGSYLVEKNKVRANKKFSSSIFFIYASHTVLLVVAVVGVIFEYVTFHSQAWYFLLLGYIAVPVVTMYLCYAGYLILKKIMPPVAKVLSGSR
jgi:hypothetical protein